MPKSVYTEYAGREEVEWYIETAKESLAKVRKAKGFAVTCPDARTGFTKVVDIAAKDEEAARQIASELQHTPLEVERFKGVIRGKPKVVRDPEEKAMLIAKAEAFLQAKIDSSTARQAHQDWEGRVGGRSTVKATRLRKAVRYGENTYVMVVRYTQTNAPSPGWVGGSVHKGDQGLIFAGDINLDNAPLGL